MVDDATSATIMVPVFFSNEQFLPTDTALHTPKPKRKRARRNIATPEQWDRNAKKMKRNRGENM